MTVRKQRRPAGLGTEGAMLWDEVTQQLAGDGMVLDARERRWLLDACREADVCADIAAALKGQPRTVPGSQGQLVAHPLLAELRMHRTTLSQLLARVNTAEPDAASGRGSKTTSDSARRAAMIRHHGRESLGS